MADPLFITTRSQLLKELRLEGIEGQATSVNEIVDAAITSARRFLYVRLGIARVDEINGYTFTESASTANEITRLTANECEREMVKRDLLRNLPVQFTDGNEAEKTWNEEGFAREMSLDEREVLIGELDTKIENLILSLITPSEADEQGSVQIDVIGPEETNTFPGNETINPVAI